MTDAADASRRQGGLVAAAATGEPARPFVGRVRELWELLAALREGAAHRDLLFLVTGAPGIGKSRLMEELARLLGRQGWRVLVGRCWEHGGAPAYWPWMQVVRAAGGELEACFPAAPAAAQPEAARFLLFDAVGRFLRGVADAGPVLVVLDDLHAADAPSLLLLRFLAQTATGERLVIVGAYRDTDPRVHELAGLLGDLARVGRRLPLAGLSRPEVAAYMERLAGRPPGPAVVARVHEVTGGNPLFVGELVRALLADGQLAGPGDPVAAPLPRIPEELRGLLHRRLAGLSPEAVANLKAASVIGRDFELRVLRRISRLSVGRLIEALAEAERAGIVSEDAAAPGRYSFSHELVREALYEDIPAGRRLRLHHSIGLALEALSRADPEPRLAELAHHFTQSARLGDAARAVEHSTRAGDRAAGLLAYEDAARHYSQALALLPLLEDGGGDRRWSLLLRLGDVQWWAGDSERAGRSFEQAAAVAGRLGAAESLARAALGYVTGIAPVRRLGLGWLVLTGWIGGRETAIRLLEQALAALPAADSPLRAQALARLATELYPSGQTERRTALGEEAVAMARRLGDPEALLVALHGRHWAALAPDASELRLANAAEMLEVATAAGDDELAFLARHARLHGLLELCDVVGVDAELQAMAALADRLGQPLFRWHVASLRAVRAILDGRLAEAERLARGTLEIPGLRPNQHMAYMHDHALLVAIRWSQGRLGELAETLRVHAERYPSVPRWRDALAAAELGDQRAARAELERHARAGFADLPRNVLWVLHLCALAEACALVGDRRRAAELYQLLSPYAERNAVSLSTLPLGPVALRLGMLAATLERWDDAELQLATALEHCRRLGARAVVPRVHYERARMLLARGAGRDRAEAAELLAQAGAACDELDLPGIAQRVAALAATTAPARPAGTAGERPEAVFRREGDYWTLAYQGELARLRDSKGLGYLACLLGRPGQEVHVLELVGAVDGPPGGPAQGRPRGAAEAGLTVSRLEAAEPLLDAQARAAYRRRLRELEDDLEEARAWSDPERAARAEAEIDALTGELARAAGLGGHDRSLATPAERARVSVTKATRTAIRTIARHRPALGDHLTASIHTGRFCSYAPPGEVPPTWSR